MIDLDDLRNHPSSYQEAADKKGITLSVEAFLKLDKSRKEVLQDVEDMRAKRNSVSKCIPSMKGKEKETALKEMQHLSKVLKKREEDLKNTEIAWKEIQMQLPSIPLDRVPVGKDENANVEVHKHGAPSSLGSTFKDHMELGKSLKILDKERGVKVSGNRGYFLKGDGALLHRAVLQFAVDHLVNLEWELFTPPLMATWECFMGTGFFPGAEALNIYAVGAKEERESPVKDDGLYLVGTSEVSVASFHKDEVLSLNDLPKKYCGASLCFRREAGSYGRDTQGLYRVHQFEKVEQIVLCEANEKKAMEHFEEIRLNAEALLQALELPYRVVDVCTGDMGQGKVFMQDIETWMPSRKAYCETHSCSYLGDFQARRLNMRYEDAEGQKHFVHTLNNTCIASPRILIPLLETYQNKDGSVTVPEVLRKYMNGKEKIIL